MFKLTLTPALIGLATLASRRFGSLYGGWLVGLPLTSGPLVYFLAAGDGVSFGSLAAHGALSGLISEVAFCVLYARIAARRASVTASFLAGTLAFGIMTVLLLGLSPTLPQTVLLILIALALAIWLVPSPSASPPAPTQIAFDVPLRMVAATAIVVALTGAAPWLGPKLSGSLSPFPVFAAVLAMFTQHSEGHVAAMEVLRGVLWGLFGFLAFFVTVAILLVPMGVGFAFAAATLAALAAQVLAAIAMTMGQRFFQHPPV